MADIAKESTLLKALNTLITKDKYTEKTDLETCLISVQKYRKTLRMGFWQSILEKKNIKHDIKILSAATKDGKIIPGTQIPLLIQIRSVLVLRDIVCFMQLAEKEE